VRDNQRAAIEIPHAVVLRTGRSGSSRLAVDRRTIGNGGNRRTAAKMARDNSQLVSATQFRTPAGDETVAGPVKTIPANAVFFLPFERNRITVGADRNMVVQSRPNVPMHGNPG